MARNLAQIVFLIFSFVTLLVTRRHLVALVERRLGKREFARRVRGGANRYLFFSVKGAMAPGLFALNLSNYCALALCFVLQLLLGWFSFTALFFKIVNSLVILSVAVEAYLLILSGNLMQFGEAFFLYRPDSDPSHDRAFASSIIDALVYAILPIALVFCNFFAL